ncbi:MAG TPA: LysR substrate-binding domain-containing protein [Candidatus Binatia bacterium]|jgi:LysR family hydrogen peroxide-inducible transcriptional activator|nr:LysR substrate-binding domain-containing protein [Candidatus Binatia bacterium]
MDLTAITLTELRYVVAAADTGHFGRAASRCHVSQPTLSAQIKKLEETLGVQLFERTPKRVQVTAVGEQVVERARVMLDELQGIGDLARGQHEPLAGPLRLGVIPTLGPYLLPWLVPPLQKAYPRLRLVLREGLTATLLDDLVAHRLDVAIVALPVGTPGIAVEPLFDEPFWVAVPAKHVLAKRTQLREGDLDGHRVLLLTEGHCLRDQALAICGDGRSGRDDDDYRATSLETLRHMVAAGLGCTLLPALALRGVPKGMVTRPFKAPSPHRRIGLAWRRSFPGVDAVHALAAFVRGTLPPGVHLVKEGD